MPRRKAVFPQSSKKSDSDVQGQVDLEGPGSKVSKTEVTSGMGTRRRRAVKKETEKAVTPGDVDVIEAAQESPVTKATSVVYLAEDGCQAVKVVPTLPKKGRPPKSDGKRVRPSRRGKAPSPGSLEKRNLSLEALLEVTGSELQKVKQSQDIQTDSSPQSQPATQSPAQGGAQQTQSALGSQPAQPAQLTQSVSQQPPQLQQVSGTIAKGLTGQAANPLMNQRPVVSAIQAKLIVDAASTNSSIPATMPPPVSTSVQQVVKIQTGERGVEKYELKSETLEQQGLKLIYTKHTADEQGTPLAPPGHPRNDIIGIRPMVPLGQSPGPGLPPALETPRIGPGRKRKHPPKPGKHICPYCGRGCAKPSVLQKHIRAHTGERPYPCVPCGFSFKTKSNLYKHCKSRSHLVKAGNAPPSGDGMKLEDGDNMEDDNIESDEVESDSEGDSAGDDSLDTSTTSETSISETRVSGLTSGVPVETSAKERLQQMIQQHRAAVAAAAGTQQSIPLGRSWSSQGNEVMSGHKPGNDNLTGQRSEVKLMNSSNPSLSTRVVMTERQYYDIVNPGKPSPQTVLANALPSGEGLEMQYNVYIPQSAGGTNYQKIEKTFLKYENDSVNSMGNSEHLISQPTAAGGLDSGEKAAEKLLTSSVETLPDKTVKVTIQVAQKPGSGGSGRSTPNTIRQDSSNTIRQDSSSSLPESNLDTTYAVSESQITEILPAAGKDPKASRPVDHKNMTPEMLSERITQLMAANQEIVNQPMVEGPRPKISRQNSVSKSGGSTPLGSSSPRVLQLQGGAHPLSVSTSSQMAGAGSPRVVHIQPGTHPLGLNTPTHIPPSSNGTTAPSAPLAKPPTGNPPQTLEPHHFLGVGGALGRPPDKLGQPDPQGKHSHGAPSLLDPQQIQQNLLQTMETAGRSGAETHTSDVLSTTPQEIKIQIKLGKSVVSCQSGGGVVSTNQSGGCMVSANQSEGTNVVISQVGGRVSSLSECQSTVLPSASVYLTKQAAGSPSLLSSMIAQPGLVTPALLQTAKSALGQGQGQNMNTEAQGHFMAESCQSQVMTQIQVTPDSLRKGQMTKPQVICSSHVQGHVSEQHRPVSVAVSVSSTNNSDSVVTSGGGGGGGVMSPDPSQGSVIKDLLLKGRNTAAHWVASSIRQSGTTVPVQPLGEDVTSSGVHTPLDSFGPYHCTGCNTSFRKPETLAMHRGNYCTGASMPQDGGIPGSMGLVSLGEQGRDATLASEQRVARERAIIQRFFPEITPTQGIVPPVSTSAPAASATSTTAVPSGEDSGVADGSAPRKKGRPKGSKNKPKDKDGNKINGPLQISVAPSSGGCGVNLIGQSCVQGEGQGCVIKSVDTTGVTATIARQDSKEGTRPPPLNIALAQVARDAGIASNTSSPVTPNTGEGTPQALWKLRLKGKLLMRRSMSVERMLSQEGDKSANNTPTPTKVVSTLTCPLPPEAPKIHAVSSLMGHGSKTLPLSFSSDSVTSDGNKGNTSDNTRLTKVIEHSRSKHCPGTDSRDDSITDSILVSAGPLSSQRRRLNSVSQVASPMIPLAQAGLMPLRAGRLVQGGESTSVRSVSSSPNMSSLNIATNSGNQLSFPALPLTTPVAHPPLLPQAMMMPPIGRARWRPDSATAELHSLSPGAAAGQRSQVTGQKSPITGQRSPVKISNAGTPVTPTTPVTGQMSPVEGTTSGQRSVIRSPTEGTCGEDSPKKSSPQAANLLLVLLGHSYPSLRADTHTSFCCVQRPQPMYVKQGHKKISMYSNWQTASINPIPAGLTTAQMLALYDSRQWIISTPTFMISALSEPKKGLLTHSSYWNFYSKQREGMTQQVETLSQHSQLTPQTIDTHKTQPENQGETLQQDKLVKAVTADTPMKRNGDLDTGRDSTGDTVEIKMEVTTPVKSETSESSSQSLSSGHSGHSGDLDMTLTPASSNKSFTGGYVSKEEYVYIRGRGRGKYVCEECGIRCKKPSMLKKHIRTHTDFRPYHCRHCNFSFKTKGNLTKHMKSKTHHKKCMELGIVPVPVTVDDSQIDPRALAKQIEISKESKIIEEENGSDEDGTDNDEEDESDEEEEDEDSSDCDGLLIDEEREDEDVRGRQHERKMGVVKRPRKRVESESSVGSTPKYVKLSPGIAMKVSTSESKRRSSAQKALKFEKSEDEGSSHSRLGTVYGFHRQPSVVRPENTGDKSTDPGTGQRTDIDAEVAKSLLDLSNQGSVSRVVHIQGNHQGVGAEGDLTASQSDIMASQSDLAASQSDQNVPEVDIDNRHDRLCGRSGAVSLQLSHASSSQPAPQGAAMVDTYRIRAIHQYDGERSFMTTSEGGVVERRRRGQKRKDLEGAGGSPQKSPHRRPVPPSNLPLHTVQQSSGSDLALMSGFAPPIYPYGLESPVTPGDGSSYKFIPVPLPSPVVSSRSPLRTGGSGHQLYPYHASAFSLSSSVGSCPVPSNSVGQGQQVSSSLTTIHHPVSTMATHSGRLLHSNHLVSTGKLGHGAVVIPATTSNNLPPSMQQLVHVAVSQKLLSQFAPGSAMAQTLDDSGTRTGDAGTHDLGSHDQPIDLSMHDEKKSSVQKLQTMVSDIAVVATSPLSPTLNPERQPSESKAKCQTSSSQVTYVSGDNKAPYEIVPIPGQVIDNSDSLVDGKYVCAVCNKSFPQQHQLTLHKNIHAIERPHKCDDCSISFRTLGHLQKHQRSESHHKSHSINRQFGTPTTDNPRPFRCEDCNIAFRIHGHLAKHLRSKAHIASLERLAKIPPGALVLLEKNDLSLIDATDGQTSLESIQQMLSEHEEGARGTGVQSLVKQGPSGTPTSQWSTPHCQGSSLNVSTSLPQPIPATHSQHIPSSSAQFLQTHTIPQSHVWHNPSSTVQHVPASFPPQPLLVQTTQGAPATRTLPQHVNSAPVYENVQSQGITTTAMARQGSAESQQVAPEVLEQRSPQSDSREDGLVFAFCGREGYRPNPLKSNANVSVEIKSEPIEMHDIKTQEAGYGDRHHSESCVLKCQLCGKECIGQESLRYHLVESHHAGAPRQAGPLPVSAPSAGSSMAAGTPLRECNICYQTFGSISALKVNN
ncbi:uncharacterized protein LOC106154122 [Lingula anatina]|uniref:Uncharacterized protein LOC106154122 n=1 Tax=Lingula anatina TaxID=7574 RepID=A0A1S3HCW7_LINAN|nr:uncharacterized protein LOC106154122 [Lingula anatina]|eukprot:XP_013383830.1 uncharacterized protein LOC106154122 [Lingula anatina]